MRIDKWLWAARFFKTRSLASQACELGRIHLNQQPAKPSKEVRVGDTLQVKNEGGTFHIEVLLLLAMRGPATVAQTMYRETEESKEARRKLVEDRKLAPEFEFAHEHRPSKRDRRLLGKLKGR